MAAAGSDPEPRRRTDARRMDEPARGSRGAGRPSARRARARGVLSHPDRVALQPRRGGGLPRGGEPAWPCDAGHVRRVLLSIREPEDAERAPRLSSCSRGGADARIRRRRLTGGGVRTLHPRARRRGRAALLREQSPAGPCCRHDGPHRLARQGRRMRTPATPDQAPHG